MAPNGTTYGALLVGEMIALFLSGIVATQVFMYRRSYPDDRLRNKVMVVVVWLLDLCHSGFICASVYLYIIHGLSDSTSIHFIQWPISATVSITGVLTFVIHCFFTIRVWTLSKHNKWLCGLILALAFCRMISAFGTVIQLQRYHSWKAFHRGAAWIFTTGLAISAIVDFLIAFSLLWFLKKSRTGFNNMDQIIDMIMLYTIENGLLTSVCTVASFICWMAMPRNFIFLGLHFCISKLYANSFLATLNARVVIKERSATSHEQHNSFPLPTISGKTARREKSGFTQSHMSDQTRSNAVKVTVQQTVTTDAQESSVGHAEIDHLKPVYMVPCSSNNDAPFSDFVPKD